MAKNVKNKKKKRSNYDDKLIKIIAISLSVAIVAIVAVALAVSYNDSYVAKVDGERIMKYEYQYFLSNTMYEMKNDAIEAGTLAEDADAAAIAAFWSADRKKEAENKALEEAKKWKAQYILAKEAGFALDYEERVNSKSNIEYNLYSSYQSYSSYYTFEQFSEMYLGMPLADYQEIAIQDAAISEYKAELKKAYNATDDELKKLYNETPDDYRKITLSVLAMEKPTEPKEVKEPEGGVDKKEADFKTQAEWIEYSADVADYKEYLEAKETYETELKELEDRRNAIINALKADGKYTEEKKEEESKDKTEDKTEDKTDSSAKTTTDVTTDSATDTKTETADKETSDKGAGDADDSSKYVYKDATLADIAEKECALFAESKGEVVINAVSESGHDILDELALTMQWKDEKRNVIVSMKDGAENTEYNGGETVDGITYTQYVPLSDDHYFYIVRCIGIEDFENSKGSEDGTKVSIKDQVRNDLYEDKADAELDAKIAAAGKKYNITNKKQDEIDAIVKGVSWN